MPTPPPAPDEAHVIVAQVLSADVAPSTVAASEVEEDVHAFALLEAGYALSDLCYVSGNLMTYDSGQSTREGSHAVGAVPRQGQAQTARPYSNEAFAGTRSGHRSLLQGERPSGLVQNKRVHMVFSRPLAR